MHRRMREYDAGLNGVSLRTSKLPHNVWENGVHQNVAKGSEGERTFFNAPPSTPIEFQEVRHPDFCWHVEPQQGPSSCIGCLPIKKRTDSDW